MKIKTSLKNAFLRKYYIDLTPKPKNNKPKDLESTKKSSILN